MRHAGLLFGAFLLFTTTAGAQVNSANSPLFSSLDTGAAAVASVPVAQLTFAPTATLFPGATSGIGAAAANSAEPSEPAPQGPDVHGVFEKYNWQAYACYTFYRFYLVPKTTLNMNGVNLGVVYYPKGWLIGADGEFVGAWASPSKLVVGMGGVRGRWSGPRGLELWGHGLVGGTHYLPQTAYGNQSAFAYEAGGGVDIGMHNHGRFAYRVSADMVGTRYFNTYQYSPKVSIGVVFKY
jgi:hypothetical protein